MLALYRCGRQADVLATYRNARSVLVEQLALEPSPPLRELQQSILRHEASLDLIKKSKAYGVGRRGIGAAVSAAPGPQRAAQPAQPGLQLRRS